jgi:dienelactone hydrolase
VRRILIIGVVVVAATVWLVMPYVSALAILIDLSGQDMPMRRWLPVSVAQVSTRDVNVPTRHGMVSARLYVPEGRSARTWIVVPGVHTGGVDEPRLARLTERLAGAGITVLSLPLPDLREFRIVGRSTDQIEDAVVWATADASITPDGTVGLVGVSFGGGLVMVAAGRPTIADRIERVVSFGGYGNLPRVIDYLCTGRLPDGTMQPAHDYGVAILLLAALPHLVPADQVASLDASIRAFLEASIADDVDPPAAAPLFARARQLAATLPEPAAAIMRDVNARDATRLGPQLLPLAEVVGGDPALSAERSPLPRAPVFLVHGAADNVIPQSETVSLAAHLRAQGHTRVTSLLSPAISHADPSTQLTTRDVWELINIWVAIQR